MASAEKRGPTKWQVQLGAVSAAVARSHSIIFTCAGSRSGHKSAAAPGGRNRVAEGNPRLRAIWSHGAVQACAMEPRGARQQPLCRPLGFVGGKADTCHRSPLPGGRGCRDGRPGARPGCNWVASGDAREALEKAERGAAKSCPIRQYAAWRGPRMRRGDYHRRDASLVRTIHQGWYYGRMSRYPWLVGLGRPPPVRGEADGHTESGDGRNTTT